MLIRKETLIKIWQTAVLILLNLLMIALASALPALEQAGF